MITVSDDCCFALDNGRICYLFRASPEGILEHRYFGASIGDSELPPLYRRLYRPAALNHQGVADCNLNDMTLEYPHFGTSDLRHPAFQVSSADGNNSLVPVFDGYRLEAAKPALKGLPSARSDDCETLVVTLRDSSAQVAMELSYSIYARHDVIARSVLFINEGEQPLNLAAALSMALDLPAERYRLLHFKGSWASEFNVCDLPAPAGHYSIGSRAGASGNLHSPFMAVLDEDCSEYHGEVRALTLMYSGNYIINVERGEFDTLRLSAGINPFNFNWRLDAGEKFQCPEALLTHSAKGLDGMSRNWHAFIRDKISPQRFSDKPRPTYLNTWESCYFELDAKAVLRLAEHSRSLGLDMLVVDDGWFLDRNDDGSSLGDWRADPVKFPNGIVDVANKVRAGGLKFGLWFEPEMISPASELYRRHPDWVIQAPGGTLSTGRGQLVLDLSRDEVVDYLFQTLDRLLSSGVIDYVKWDMNRLMTEVGSTDRPADRQMETCHRYILGLYQLVGRITEKYPDILFENCASGSNRLDPGMLRFMSQSWLSDMSDPIGRLTIQQGASYLYPPSVQASYICPVPNHQNGRMTSLQTRAAVVFFCAARGMSLNPDEMDAQRRDLTRIVQVWKDTSSFVVNAHFHRLKQNANEYAWQLSDESAERLFVGYVHILALPNGPRRRVRLRHLPPAGRYRIHSHYFPEDEEYSGSALMNVGIEMPLPSVAARADASRMSAGDFVSCLLEFRMVK